ncbi:hypothetical protein Clacol_008665 [Clathrus columnatus]|uniref:Uncharacterized protein n=1 Tax=Clathrus columnatus TaxID=1419009 RepID=A0AAV5AIC1_9AGAM|nr:hypothetical protein Clacol_008665 [Clathrus columnatus]
MRVINELGLNIQGMSKTAKGLIRAENHDVYSKFKLECSFGNQTNDIWTFNVNSDIALPKFWSFGADKSPIRRNLIVTYDNPLQFSGFDRFYGSIGDGKIYVRTDKGVTLKGPIAGGPIEGQTFTGAGTWLKGEDVESTARIGADGDPGFSVINWIKDVLKNCFC